MATFCAKFLETIIIIIIVVVIKKIKKNPLFMSQNQLKYTH